MNDHSSGPKGALLARGRQEYSIAKRKESYANVQELINDGHDLHHAQPLSGGRHCRSSDGDVRGPDRRAGRCR